MENQLEHKILSLHCDENPVYTACKYLSLLDKNELNRDDLTWEEIEPYTRILGIRTQDLYNFNPFLKQDVHKIEGKLIESHSKLCKIFQTSDIQSAALKLSQDHENIDNKIKQIEEKQKKLCSKTLEYLEEIKNKLNDFNLNEKDDRGPFNELALRLKYIELKAKFLKNSINSEVYNERSSRALKIIRDELESTYEEYNDVRRMLIDRIRMYENNDSIQSLLKRYSVVKQRILKKKQDILSISK